MRGSGAHINLYDPAGLENAKKDLGNDYVTYKGSAEEVFDKADALVILTEWPDFVGLDYTNLVNKLKEKVIFDGRNLLDPKKMAELGVEYYAIGRSKAK